MIQTNFRGAQVANYYCKKYYTYSLYEDRIIMDEGT